MMTIRPATTADEDAVIGLRIEAEAWLHAAGIQQWVDRARGIRSIQASIASGTTHVVLDSSSNVVASLTLGAADEDFWGPQDSPADGLYLYKFMVSRSHRGLGGGLLDWAAAQAAAQGRQWLRLDCWRDNSGLHRYYQRHGFCHVRTMMVPGRDSGALFQRPATQSGRDLDARSGLAIRA